MNKITKLLFRVMCLPENIDDVILTSDGYYIAKAMGDIGYNSFLGKPNPQPHSRERFNALSKTEQDQILALAKAKGFNLSDFGIEI